MPLHLGAMIGWLANISFAVPIKIHQSWANLETLRELGQGIKRERGEKNLCFLIITEYHPRVGSCPCCSHGLCHFGEAAGNNLSRNTVPRALVLDTLDLVLQDDGI